MPVIGVLRDDFSSNTLPTNWPGAYGGTIISSGRLNVACLTSYSGAETDYSYTVNGSGVRVQVTPAALSGATVEAFTEVLFLSGTAGLDIGVHYDAVTGLLSMMSRSGYYDANQLEVTYDPVQHAWWGIRLVDEIVYWETSADGTTWKTHRTAAAPSWAITSNAVALNLSSRRSDGVSNIAYFDNVNVLPESDGMVTLKVEISFGGASSSTLLTIDDPTRGLLNTGTLGEDSTIEPFWTDVTEWVKSGSTRRGASRADGPIYRYEAGTCTITLDNNDRRFDPTNLNGPYVSGGVSQVTAMRGIRISVDWGGSTYQVFRGFIDMWDISWEEPEYSEVVVTATDAFKIFSGIDRVEQAPVGGGEDTGARVNRILDSADWDELDRIVATGDSTLQETTLSGDVLSELLTAVGSELGEVYINTTGHLVFRNRTALLTDTRSNLPQALFGDGGAYELKYHDLGLSNDDATFANVVIVTREGGTPQVATDSASIVVYYKRTFSHEGVVLENDGDAADLASWLLYVSRDPELRFDTISVLPRSDANHLWPQALGREIGDRIEIIRRPPGGGDPIDRDVFIRGIEHEFEPLQWKTTFSLQSAARYGSFFTLNNASLGRLNNNALSY